jgi:hypothetical protein
MNTDCLDVDEILLTQSVKQKSNKDVKPLSDLVNSMRGE